MKHRSRAFARGSSDCDGNGLDRLTPYTGRIHPMYAVALQTREHCVLLNREVMP